MLRVDEHARYLTDVVPALLVYSLGLALTVAPLTATVLADADEHDAGIASAVNNTIARSAALLATAAVGALLASFYAYSLDRNLGARPLQPQTRAAVAHAKDRVMDPISPAAAAPADRARARAASSRAGVEAFHLAVGVGAGLLAIAGLVGGALLRDPRRATEAVCCAGGALTGAPEPVGRAATDTPA
jgi:hypothetical protein